ncbi:MAG: hypothetical protein CM15mP32_0530 [Flavobacteriaceae bacterium]|nr:MAG: hypothetical protein CM15mP32_0530 [Flavobacteriaceae bacterium]
MLKAQIDHYEDLENDVDMLSQFTTRHSSVDFAGYIRKNKENEPILVLESTKEKQLLKFFSVSLDILAG